MSRQQMLPHWAEWISFAGDSRARISHSLDASRVLAESKAVFGRSTGESFASFDRASLSWKTYQRSLQGEWGRFSGIWPLRGTLQNGNAYALPTSEHRISEIGCSFWPTPTATDAKASGSAHLTTESGRHTGTTLTDAAVRGKGGHLNPAWVETLMGFPMGWTDVSPTDGPPRQASHKPHGSLPGVHKASRGGRGV